MGELACENVFLQPLDTHFSLESESFHKRPKATKSSTGISKIISCFFSSICKLLYMYKHTAYIDK